MGRHSLALLYRQSFCDCVLAGLSMIAFLAGNKRVLPQKYKYPTPQHGVRSGESLTESGKSEPMRRTAGWEWKAQN